jgi:hypothetical protein
MVERAQELTPTQVYCGVDLHARSLYIGVLDQAGATVLHRNLKAEPGAFLDAVAPYRDGLAVACACMFAGYWLADLCAAEGFPSCSATRCSMKAGHGGKAKNDKVDAGGRPR